MKRALRIAVWYNLPSGGARRALYNHLKGLVTRGHSVEIWSPPLEPVKFGSFEGLGPEHTVPLKFADRDHKFYFSKLYHAMYFPDRRVDGFEAHSRECARQMHAQKFDLVFANTDMWFHAPFIGRFTDLPKVLYLQEPNRPMYEMLPEMPWLARPRSNPIVGWGLGAIKARGRDYASCRHARIYAREEIENAKTYDRILVNSFFSRESVLRAYGTDARVCYLGVDTYLFERRDQPRENMVIGIGSFGRAKNVELVIRAVGTLTPAKRPKVVWVGNMKIESYFDEMIQLANELGVDYEPKYLIPDPELVDLLNRAKLMAYAPRLEPFGFAPIEAGACGLPVVAVAEGGVRETVVHDVNGFLVDHDPVEMGRAIQRILEDDDLRIRLGETGFRRAHEIWGVEASNDRLEHHLFEVLESKQ